MEELLQQLQAKAGITAEQAEKSLHTIKEYIITKFPMLEGAVTNMFGPTVITPVSPVAPVGTASATPSVTDKLGEFAHNAADKAEEMYDSAKDKLTDFFGNKRD